MFYMNLNYNHHTLSVECGKEMAAIKSFDEKYKPHEHVSRIPPDTSGDHLQMDGS